MLLPLFCLLSGALSAQAVTLYTTFTADRSGNRILPTNTNTALGTAYTGLTGNISASSQFRSQQNDL